MGEEIKSRVVDAEQFDRKLDAIQVFAVSWWSLQVMLNRIRDIDQSQKNRTITCFRQLACWGSWENDRHGTPIRHARMMIIPGLWLMNKLKWIVESIFKMTFVKLSQRITIIMKPSMSCATIPMWSTNGLRHHYWCYLHFEQTYVHCLLWKWWLSANWSKLLFNSSVMKLCLDGISLCCCAGKKFRRCLRSSVRWG